MITIKVRVETDHPVAVHSPDHQQALHSGSGNDNSTNHLFNKKLFDWVEKDRFSVLDLGCAGGGFVKSLIDQGAFAVGLEGSDYSKNIKRAEWATIPDNLFTCDITKPFQIRREKSPEYKSDWWPQGKEYPIVLFDVVTAWEVMEHISEQELPQLIQNVLLHLASDGIWIMSVSPYGDGNFHRCVHDMGWWLEVFARHGLEHHPEIRAEFDPDFVRGPLQTPWAIQAPGSFHLVLKRK